MTDARNPRAVLRDVHRAAYAAGVGPAATHLLVCAWARLNPGNEWENWSLAQLADDADQWYGNARRHWARLIAAGLIVAKPAEPGRAALWQMGDLAAAAAAHVPRSKRPPVDPADTPDTPRVESRGHPASDHADTPRDSTRPTPRGITRTQAMKGHDQTHVQARLAPPLVIRAPGQSALPGLDDLAANRAERRRRQRALANAATATRARAR